jgi:hypothetical protein
MAKKGKTKRPAVRKPENPREAAAKYIRPPPELYDPDSISHWSITMMVAWIIWGEIDAVRNEWDDYRNDCADKPSGLNELRLRAILQKLPLQVVRDAIASLWRAAGEGRIQANAIEYENAKAFVGNPIKIPAHYWPHLKHTDDPLSGKAMLFGPDGRVYREVKFPQLDGKTLWPKSPLLPGGAGAWIAAEAKRMKDANEISPDIGISDFARELEGRMQKAATTNKSLRPIKWRSIKNKLREWGLWQVTSIK